jgi:hypothetical protein
VNALVAWWRRIWDDDMKAGVWAVTALAVLYLFIVAAGMK